MDNSVLFSLSELKAIEQERVAVEAADAVAYAELADHVQREAEEAQRLAAEDERRAAEARRRQEAAERERARRAEELRLVEAEARMERDLEREGELRLEAARLEAEARMALELKAARRPLGVAVAVGVAALFAVAGLGTWLMRSEDVVDAQSRAVLEQTYDARSALEAEREARQRARLDAELTAVREQLEALAPKPPAPTAAPTERARASRAGTRPARKKVAAAAHAPAPSSLLDGDTSLLGD